MNTSVAKILFLLRRFFTGNLALFASIAGGYFLSRGTFKNLFPVQEHQWAFGGMTLLCVIFLFSLFKPRAKSWSNRRRMLEQLQTGLLGMALLYLGIQTTGGITSWLQPLAYLLIAYLVGFSVRWAGVLLILGTLAFQASLHLASGELPHHWQNLAFRGSLILLFALANMLFLRVEIFRSKREHKERLSAEIRAMHKEARDFRLISPASSIEGRARGEAEVMLTCGAVQSIHQSMYFLLELLKKSLNLQTCVLYWLDASEKMLRIKEMISDSKLVRESPIYAGAGVLWGVVKDMVVLNLHRPQRKARTIPYYEGPEVVGAFLGVPIVENGHLRGVLAADRREDHPFTVDEEHLMVEACTQVLHAVQSERVFSAVERSKYEHERFYRASSMLNGALTLSQVYDTALGAAREISVFDFAAITLFDWKRNKHIVCRVFGEGREALEGLEFGSNAGLVSMVVKNRHFLPAVDDPEASQMVIFTRKYKVKGMNSLVVLPLIVQDSAIGTFVFAARERGRFPKKIREMLGVICNQVAVSIENAKMYKQMEEMATTDGLTGLPNHRTFQARASEMLHRADRHDKPLAIILTDIDKFKSVNDTYGHPVGDTVLRRVANVLASQVRKIDLVARYGGEEFAMVLEETDAKGAKLLCERVRQEVAAQVMSSEKGSFRVTISLGIATYPRDGNTKQVLIERADQALYTAKENGRNRTICFSEVQKIQHEEKIHSRHQCASS